MAAFSRRHYEMVADAVAAAHSGKFAPRNQRETDQYIMQVEALSLVFSNDNPRFEAIRFAHRAGVTDFTNGNRCGRCFAIEDSAHLTAHTQPVSSVA